MNDLPAAKNRRVLVIDDNRAIHDDFRKILFPATAMAAALDATEAALFGQPPDLVEQTQFEVDSAYQGQEGVMLAAKALEAGRPYAMAFVDVRMPPGWDGMETTGKLWELDPDLQVVICTAYSDYSWSEMFNELGRRDGVLILKKPFDSVEALQLAHALTEKWWLHQQTRRKMEELEGRVTERTRELQQTNDVLQQEVVEHTRAEESLRERTGLANLEAEVGTALTRGGTLAEILRLCSEAIVKHLEAAFARIWTLNEKEKVLELQASAGRYTHLNGPHGRVPVGKFKIGLIAEERKPHVTNHVAGDPRVGDQEWAKREGLVAFAGYPLLVEDRLVGVVAMFAQHKLTDVALRALTSIANNIALGIQRIRTDAALRQSEERMRLQTAALESAANGVAITDRNGTIQWVNRAFTALTGYSAEEVVGQNPRVLKSGRHPESFFSEMWQTISKGQVWNGEIINRRKDGQWYDEEMTITPVRDSEGGISHFVAIKQDISDRKRVEEDREKFIALIENSGDFIGMATLEGKPFYVNKAGRELVGLDRELDVCSTDISDFSDPETAALLQNTAIPASLALGQWAGEGKLRHFASHALIPVHIHSFLVRNPETQEPICLATVQRNITDLKEAEKKLEQAHRELLDLSRLSGMAEIATSVLHNVGNVLNSVNVSADRISEKVKRLRPSSLPKVAALLREHAHDLSDFLGRDPQGKEVPGYLSALVEQLADPQKDILPEVVSLRNNIEHIREIVRMQQNYARVSGVLETMALTDLIEDAIRINAAGLTRHEVQLIREYAPLPPFPIDKHKVLQILVNLLNNAKYALDADGRRDSQLTVRVEMNGGGTVKILVIDNGVGIAPENLTRIFQHGFTTRKDGHGFGLHSGALAAQELGGCLTAQSAGTGQGAVFTLELPCPREASNS